MEQLIRDTFVEINLDNIAFNMKKIKEVVGKDVAIAAVVKANAYGHGAVDCAKFALQSAILHISIWGAGSICSSRLIELCKTSKVTARSTACSSAFKNISRPRAVAF